MADTPKWFDENVYLNNKLAQLKSVEPDVEWNLSTLKVTLESAGFTPYEHFNAFGAAEHISPNADFNVAEYLAAKAAQMNANLKDGETPWTEASIAKAIKDAGMTEWSHYQMFGSKEGVNPSNAFDADAYLTAKAAAMNAAGEKQPDGSDWTAEAVKNAIHNENMSVLEHYELYKGAGDAEVPADAVYKVPADEKVVPSITFNPYLPDHVGKSFTLTDGADSFTGTADSDTITGALGNLGVGDSIIDTNPNDQDLLVLDAGMASKVDTKATVKGIENISINTDAVRDLEVDVQGFEGMQTLRVNASADSFANLKVTGLTKATVEAGKASSVDVAGTAAEDDAVVLKLNAAEAKVTSTNIETLTISSDVAAKVALASAVDAVKTAGDGDIVLSMAVSGATSDHSITKGNTGTLTVELTGSDTAANTTKIAAGVDSITFADATDNSGTTVTANNGQNFVLKDSSSFTFKMASTNTATNDSVNVALADGKTYTVKTGEKLENITINAAKGNTLTELSGAADVADTATVTGSDTLKLGTVSNFKTLDASAFTGTLEGTGALDGLNILGGTGTNTLTLDVSDGKTTFYKGTGEGVDKLTVAASGSGTMVVDAGAGKDSVTLGTIVENAVASIDLGAGDDTLAIGAVGTAATITGELLAKAGEGDDTITLVNASVASAGKVNIDAGAGNDVITLTDVSIADGGTLTIDGGAGDDTFILDTVATAGVTLNGGEGDDTLTLKGASYSGITLDSIEHIKLDANTATTVGASMISGKTLDISSVASALTIKAAATDTVIDLANVKVNMAADTIDLSGATLASLTKVVGTNANDTFEFGAITAGKFTGNLDGGTGSDTLSIGSDASISAFDFTKATVTGIETVTFGGGSTANTLTVGNNFVGATYSVAFTQADNGAADIFKIDLTASFTDQAASKADEVLKAGDWFVSTDQANLIYRDDDGDLITVHLIGVANNGVTSESGDLKITGGTADA